MKIEINDFGYLCEKRFDFDNLCAGRIDGVANYLVVDFEDGTPIQVYSDSMDSYGCSFDTDMGEFITLAERAYEAGQKSRWLPIEQAPKQIKPMILVKAYLENYTTDPYAVFWCDGKWNRWPHDFEPTHFMYIPE